MSLNDFLEMLVSKTEKCCHCEFRHFDSTTNSYFCYFASKCLENYEKKEG